jgi:hypothetical protein
LRYPFLTWRGVAGTIYFCAKCCQDIERGFRADLTRINHAAICKIFTLTKE